MARLATAMALACLLLVSIASSAEASQAVEAFSVGTSTTAAGGHPDLTMSVAIQNPGNPEAAERITVNEPEGLFGNPRVVPLCNASDFAFDQCPTDSQVGVITVRANHNGEEDFLLGTAPMYDLETQSEDETARFGFIAPTVNIPISIPITVRTAGDYGLRFSVSGISESIPVKSVNLTVWGFPAAHVHDEERFRPGSPGSPAGCPGETIARCASLFGSAPVKSGLSMNPLIDNPSRCTGEPLTAVATVTTYQDRENPSVAEATYPATTECERESFAPVADVAPTTEETDSASGLDVILHDPQPEGLTVTPSAIKAVKVVLPEGLSINPDAADGQRACTDAEANLNDEGPAHCPDTSKIGNFDIESEALEGSLFGSLYIAEPKPGDQYRIFMIASGFGIHAKLLASVRPDPATGRLTVLFDRVPQVPFNGLNVHLFASDRGLMATPTRCTLYASETEFIPWDSHLPPQNSISHFGLTAGPGGTPCAGQTRPFHPNLVSGSAVARAGAFSSFTLNLDREDGNQFLDKVNFEMPPGLTADLHGVTYCPEAAIKAAAAASGREELANSSCPASSEIGTSNVAAGPGSHPFHAVGKLYFAGPFEGAPLSLVAITPALAGPYDYGTVVVRVALHLDSLDAHVIAISQSMPKIIGGIPIRMREIRVNINRPNFMINPTNCSPFSVVSESIGDQGASVAFTSPFHAVNCESLPFAPRMTITQVGGRKQTTRAKDPSLRFDLWTRPGEANIKSVAVTLPKAFQVDQRHLGNICSRGELVADHCQGRQAIGTLEVATPLLERPLKGLAYAVSGYGRLPHLAFILSGQVTIVPEAESSSVKGGHLKTVVPVVPDAPVGHFSLTLFGGGKGYITNTRSLCAAKAVSLIEFAGQNGKSVTRRVAARTACKAKSIRPNHRSAKRVK